MLPPMPWLRRAGCARRQEERARHPAAPARTFSSIRRCTMVRWRELAAAAHRVDPNPPEASPTYGLPDDLVARLRYLANLPAPEKLEDKSQWRTVVRDALAIAQAGWAAS